MRGEGRDGLGWRDPTDACSSDRWAPGCAMPPKTLSNFKRCRGELPGVQTATSHILSFNACFVTFLTILSLFHVFLSKLTFFICFGVVSDIFVQKHENGPESRAPFRRSPGKSGEFRGVRGAPYLRRRFGLLAPKPHPWARKLAPKTLNTVAKSTTNALKRWVARFRRPILRLLLPLL